MLVVVFGSEGRVAKFLELYSFLRVACVAFLIPVVLQN